MGKNDNDLSAKVGLDITDYKANAAALSRQARVIESDFRATAAGMDDWSSSSEGLQARIKALTGIIEAQKQKVENLQAIYAKIAAEMGENSKAAQDLQIKINNETAALNKNQLELQTVTAKLDSFGKETKEAAAAEAEATKQGGLLGKIFAGGFFANLATSALSFLKTKLKEVVLGGIELASNLTEIKNVVDTTFGKDAGKIETWAKKAASAFGLSELNAKKFNGTLGSMLKSAGITGDALTKMSTDLVGVAADFGSFYNLDVEDSFDKIRQAIGGQSDGLKQLGIDLNQNNIMQTEYAKSLNKTWNEMTSAEQATARYKAILELGADALGDFSKTSDSYANKLKILSLEFDNLKLAIGERLLPIADKAVNFLTRLVSGGDSAAESMQKLQNAIGNSRNTLDLIKQYESLKSQLDNTALSEEQVAIVTTRLAAVKQDLVEASNGVITAADIENDTFDKQVDVLQSLTQTQLDYNKQQLIGIVRANTGYDAAEKQRKAQEKYDAVLKRLNDTNAAITRTTEEMSNTTYTAGIDYMKLLADLEANAASFEVQLEAANDELLQTKADSLEANSALLTLMQGGMTAAEVMQTFGIDAEELAARLATVRVAAEGGASAIAQQSYELNQLTAAYGVTISVQELMDQQQEEQTQTALRYKDQIIALGGEIAALKADYDTAKQAAIDSLTSTIGLWNEMDTKAKTSVKEVQGALQSQVDWLAEYNDNLTALASREIPEVDTTQLVQSLSDGSTESAEILAGLATATDEEIANIVDLMGGISEGKETLATTMAEINTNFQEKMDELAQKAEDLVDEMNNSAEAGMAARNTMNGYIAATYAMVPSLRTAYEYAAEQANDAYRDALEIHSPSKVAMKGTEDYFRGHILEAAVMAPIMSDAFAKSARMANEAAQRELNASLRQHLIYSAETASVGLTGGRGTSFSYPGMAMVYSILDGKVISATLSPIQYDNNNAYERALGRILA